MKRFACSLLFFAMTGLASWPIPDPNSPKPPSAPLFRTPDGDVTRPQILCAKHPAIAISADSRFLFVDLAELGAQRLVVYRGKDAIVYSSKSK